MAISKNLNDLDQAVAPLLGGERVYGVQDGQDVSIPVAVIQETLSADLALKLALATEAAVDSAAYAAQSEAFMQLAGVAVLDDGLGEDGFDSDFDDGQAD